MFALDPDESPDEDDDDDMLVEEDAVAEVQDSEEGTQESEEDTALPSGLTPYWVKFLLRQGSDGLSRQDGLRKSDLDKRS